MLRKNTYQILYRHPILTGILFSVILSVVSLSITVFAIGNVKRSAELDAKSIMMLVQQSVNQAFTVCHNASLTLAKCIGDDGQVHDFDSLAPVILAQYENIDALQLVPDGIIQYTYPLAGNEAAIGLNIMQDPKVMEEALEVVRRNDFYFAGPVELRQGGKAVVGRLPIFINHKFWGFSAVIIKLDHLLSAIGLINSLQKDYYFQFSKVNPITKLNEDFLPPWPRVLFAVVDSYYLENGGWKLMVMKPIRIREIIGIVFLSFFSLGFSVLSGIFLTNLLMKPSELSNKLEAKTAELFKSEQRKRAILQVLPDLLFVVDKNGVFTDYHMSSFLKPEIPPQQFLNQRILDIIPPEIAIKAIENIQKVLDNDILLMHEYSIADKHFEARYVKSSNEEVLIIIRDMTERATYINAIERQNTTLREIAWEQSHQVRAPLARLLGLVAWLEQNYGRDATIEQKMFTGIISSAKELDDIIRSIVKKTTTIKIALSKEQD